MYFLMKQDKQSLTKRTLSKPHKLGPCSNVCRFLNCFSNCQCCYLSYVTSVEKSVGIEKNLKQI